MTVYNDGNGFDIDMTHSQLDWEGPFWPLAPQFVSLIPKNENPPSCLRTRSSAVSSTTVRLCSMLCNCCSITAAVSTPIKLITTPSKSDNESCCRRIIRPRASTTTFAASFANVGSASSAFLPPVSCWEACVHWRKR